MGMKIVKSPAIRRMRYALLRFTARGAIIIARSCPRSVGLAFFGLLGRIVYMLPHSDRDRTRLHLSLVFGATLSRNELAALARDVYRQLGKNVFDAFLLPRLSRDAFDRVVTHDPLDELQKAYAQGRGCIAITAHTGCFEMLLHFVAERGYRTFAIGKKLKDEQLDSIIRTTRSGENITYMDRSESPRKMVRNLQAGMVFGVLIDQDTAVEGVFADFLGRKAYTPSGPIKMAMKLNIPVFVITTARREDDTHHIYVKGPIALKTSGDFERDLVDNVTTANSLICDTITRHPSQWVWMHRRWRRQPPAADGERSPS